MKKDLAKHAKTVVLTLSLIGVLSAGAERIKASDLCGSTIVTDLILDHDLTCTGNGLIVGADGIKIHLNGHTITGPGSGRGISLSLRSGVSIQGGTIRNFESGVFVANSSEITIKRICLLGIVRAFS